VSARTTIGIRIAQLLRKNQISRNKILIISRAGKKRLSNAGRLKVVGLIPVNK